MESESGSWLWVVRGWSRHWGDRYEQDGFLPRGAHYLMRQTDKQTSSVLCIFIRNTKFALRCVCVRHFTHTFYTFTDKFVLNITGFSLFSGFSKILTIGFHRWCYGKEPACQCNSLSMSSSLPQSRPGSGTEDLCQTVPAIPSSLEKHQEPYSLQWIRSVLGSVAPDLERGMPGWACPILPLPGQPRQFLPWGLTLSFSSQSGLQPGETHHWKTKTLAGKTKAQHSVVMLAHGDKYEEEK